MSGAPSFRVLQQNAALAFPPDMWGVTEPSGSVVCLRERLLSDERQIDVERALPTEGVELGMQHKVLDLLGSGFTRY